MNGFTAASLVLFVLTVITTESQLPGGRAHPFPETDEYVYGGQCTINNICAANDSDLLTIPCGSFLEDSGVSFTYYTQADRTLLSEGLTQFLQVNASRNYTGTYVCCRPNISSTDVCYQLNITYPPIKVEVENIPGYSKIAIYGAPFQLKCPLEGNPPCIYWWEKYMYPGEISNGNVRLNLTDDLVFSPDGRTWTVYSYNEAYNGNYVCFAINSLGTAEYNGFFLSAQKCESYDIEQAKLTISPTGETNYEPGINVHLNCSASSVSYPSFPRWFIADNDSLSMLSFTDPHYDMYEEPFSSKHCSWTVQLTIKNFSKELAGDYICGFPTNHESLTVTIEECYQYEEDDINVEITPQNTTYPVGVDVLLSCTAVNISRNLIPMWIVPDSANCTNGTCDLFDYVTSSYDEKLCQWTAILAIASFKKYHAGTYSCEVGSHIDTITLTLDDTGVADTWKNSDDPATKVVIAIVTVGLAAVIGGCVTISAVLVLIRRNKSVSYMKSKEPPADGFIYDVFISAHDEVRNIAHNNILLPLERDCNPPYKVCWHLRDFVAGLPITEQIAEAVQQSRKVIFIFSEHFTESEYCCLELEHTLHRLVTTQTRCMIPITLNEETVPKELKSRITYWPVVSPDRDDFVDKICKLIGNPISDKDSDHEEDLPLI